MADVTQKIITGNSVKIKSIQVVKTNGGKSFQSKSNGVTDANLVTNMDNKYTTKFDETDFHVV